MFTYLKCITFFELFCGLRLNSLKLREATGREPAHLKDLSFPRKGQIRLEMGAAKFGSEGILAVVSAQSAAAETHKSAFRKPVEPLIVERNQSI